MRGGGSAELPLLNFGTPPLPHATPVLCGWAGPLGWHAGVSTSLGAGRGRGFRGISRAKHLVLIQGGSLLLYPLLLFTTELINARWPPSLPQRSFPLAIWEGVCGGAGVGVGGRQGNLPAIRLSSVHAPTLLPPASFQSLRRSRRCETRPVRPLLSRRRNLGGGLLSACSRPFRPWGGALPTPRSARSRRALGPRRAAVRRYKRPRCRPTRNPRLRPVPAS